MDIFFGGVYRRQGVLHKITAVDFKDHNPCCGSNPATDVRYTFQKYKCQMDILQAAREAQVEEY
jgi:hypothetical protein